MVEQTLTVEIWSDLVCPWCFLGKRRFEQALEGFEHREQVTVRWRSFELDPSATSFATATIPDRMQYLQGMSAEEAQRGISYLTELAREAGLDYNLCRARPVNSMDAHRLLHASARLGGEDALRERLSVAYVKEGRNIADHDTLIELAAEEGLDPAAMREVLRSDAYVVEVREDVRKATQVGVVSVPSFLFGGIHLLRGAPSTTELRNALECAWSSVHN